jgi:exosortase D (VPLPA-CTERM-specific)
MTAPVSGRQSAFYWTDALLLVAMGMAIIAVFGASLSELVHRWQQQEEYSHGVLIPFISAWLLWTRRDALRRSLGQPSAIGFALLAVAILLHIVGVLSAVFVLSHLAFVLSLLSLSLTIGGFTLLRATLMPILYLLFAIPLPYFVDAKLTLQLQLISSQLGVFLIRLVQIPVYLEGNIIDMGSYKLQVIEACSGLRFLYPLLSLSFLAAYLFRSTIFNRVIVFLSSIPIAVSMNGLRIGMVGVLVDRWGPNMAEGGLHFFEGWIIFLGCAAVLIAEMAILAWFSGLRLRDAIGLPFVVAPSRGFRPATSALGYPVVAYLFILCVGAALSAFIGQRAEHIPSRARFVAFPTTIGDWQGRTENFDPATEQFLRVDDYILADYSRTGDKPVNFYVAYYASQREAESPHSPVVCLPGGGWLITSLERTSLVIDGKTYHFNRVTIENGPVKNLVYYWFDERGRIIANEYAAKWYLLLDSISKGRTDGALVRLTTTIDQGGQDRADRRSQNFMEATLPRLTTFIPGDSTAKLRRKLKS